MNVHQLYGISSIPAGAPTIHNKVLPMAGIHNDGSGAIGIGNKGAILSIHSYGLDIMSVVVGEIQVLVDPVIGQPLWIIQIYSRVGDRVGEDRK